MVKIRRQSMKILKIFLLFSIFSGCSEKSSKKDIMDIYTGEEFYEEYSEEESISFDIQEIKDFEEILPFNPLANVFFKNPIEDNYKTSVVGLKHILHPEHKLSGHYAHVLNCLNIPGGKSKTIDFGGMPITISLCVEDLTATPGIDGTFLHILPPDGFTDPDDPFAEIMMYYHISEIHDYFKENFGYKGMDFPLYAIVNFQIYISGYDWLPLDNAAYIPKESFETIFGFPQLEDSLIFGQGFEIDFSYDADVIAHEYTHAVVGKKRLVSNVADQYGFDNSPLSLNEAYADYFAASIHDDSLIGNYALTAIYGQNMSRDISKFHKCPDDLIGESHSDGLIYSSALWEIRQSIGKDIADKIIMDSLLTFTEKTNFKEASLSIMDESENLDEIDRKKIKEILENHGVVDCLRLRPYKDFSMDGINPPLIIEGTLSSQLTEFQDYVPSVLQFELPLDEKTVEIEFQYKVENLMDFLSFLLPPIDVDMLVKKGSMINYNFSGEITTNDASLELESSEIGDNEFSVIVSGECLKNAKLYIQFLNRSVSGVIIKKMQLIKRETPTIEPNYNKCGG